LAILRREGRIGWEPGEDAYADLIPDGVEDRNAAKVAVNAFAYRGPPIPGAAGRPAELLPATAPYRAAGRATAPSRRSVTTLAGRAIPVDAAEDNFAGKALHRVVQGTAGDIFNGAAVRVERALAAEGLGAVAFLLHDELWCECDPADLGRVEAVMGAVM